MADQQDYSGQIKIEFDLQFGIEYKDKTLKHVVMRRVRNSDILAVQADIKMRDLADKKFTADNMNPVSGTMLNAASIQLYTLLFARVIEYIGDVKPDIEMLSGLIPKDYDLIFDNYMKLNEINVAGALENNPFFREIMKIFLESQKEIG